MNRSEKHYTPEEIAGMLAMRKNGKSAREIAEAYGRTRAAINTYFSAHKLTDNEAGNSGIAQISKQGKIVLLDEKAFNDFLSKTQMTREAANKAIYETNSFWSKVFRDRNGEVLIDKIDYLICKTGGDPGEILPTLLKKEAPKAEPRAEKVCAEEPQIDLNAKLDELGRAVLLLHEDLQKIYGLLK